MQGILQNITRQWHGLDRLLLRNVGAVFSLKIISQILAFALFILLARYLGVEEIGIYIYVWGWIQILLVFSTFGMDMGATRFLPALAAKDSWAQFHGFQRIGFLTVAIASISLSLSGMLILYTAGSEMVKAFTVGLAMLPFLALTVYEQAVLRSMNNTVKGMLGETLIRPGLQIILIICCIWAGVKASALIGLGAALISSFAAFVVVSILTVRLLQQQEKPGLDFKERKDWLIYAVTMAIISGGAIILRQTDVVMLGILTESKQVGLYGAAVRIANLATFALASINLVIGPMIAGLYSSGDHKKLQKLLAQSSFINLITSIFIVGILWIGAHLLLSLFGQVFVAAEMPLKILLAAQMLNALSGAVGYMMTMTGHQKQMAFIFTGTIIINIVMNVIAIPIWGIEGAAFATGASTVLWNGAMLFYVIKRIGFNPSVFSLLRYAKA